MSDAMNTQTNTLSLDRLRELLGFQVGALALVMLVVSAILAALNENTKEAIEEAELRDTQISLAQVLPEGYNDNNLVTDIANLDTDGGPIKVHLSRKNGELNGAVMELADKGYGGKIAMVVGVDRDGKVLGVRVTRHNETPGLGDKIEAAKGDWIHSFENKRLGDPAPEKWAVKKDGGIFDQFAGATITPRGVVRGVKRGLEAYAAHRDELIATPAK
jgi:H+/Na+-translocating ferredoxin:NAD+ oxidoreductase subunit G